MRFQTKTAIALFALSALASANLIAAESKSAAPKPAATGSGIPAGQAHVVGSAKLIIGDVKENQTFFEKVFGMKEVNHYSSKDAYDEPIMGFDSGARLALFHPLVEKPLTKSQFPV